MKLSTPYDSLRSLQANLSNVITVDADISQRTIYWTDTHQKRIFAYQYASSMSSQNLLAKQLNKMDGPVETAVHNPVGANAQANAQANSQSNGQSLSQSLSQVQSSTHSNPLYGQPNQTRKVVGGKRKEQLGHNMTLIWKNVKNVLIDKVAGWVGTTGLTGATGGAASQKKLKSTKNKQKQERLIQKAKQKSKLMNSNRISKSAFGLGNVRTVHRVGIGEVNSLAVDTLGRKLYFTDSLRRRIEVSHLNGKQRKILIHRDLDR